jgi:hypothetical protein
VFVLLYYFNFVGRAFLRTGATPPTGNLGTKLSIPSIDIIEAAVFGVFVVLSSVSMLGALTPRGGFRASDVDVLFPTPINPKSVLGFRMVRDYLVTFLVPLFFFAVTGRGAAAGYELLFRDSPVNGPLAIKMMSVAWVLMSLAWVCLGFGFSLFVNRSDEASDRNKKIINGALFGSLLLVFVYGALRLRADLSWQTALDLSRDLFVRIVFFAASGATAIVDGALEGNYVGLALGVAGLGSLSILGIWLAVSQVGYMYDQAAARGFGSQELQKLQRSGDMFGVVAERARQGKVKRGKLSIWVSRHPLKGAGALVWKEILLQLRGSSTQFIIFVPVLLLIMVPLWSQRQGSVQTMSVMLLVMLAFGSFLFTMGGATSGYIELLRRIDLQKPLPFSPTVTVIWETISKALPAALICSVTAIVVTCVDLRLWPAALAAIVLLPSLAIVLSSVVLIITLLFPDVDDATQRGFRGLMTMLGTVIAVFPGALIVGVLMGYLKLFPLLAAIPAAAVNLAIAGGLCAVAGGLYAQFNASE